MNKHRIYRSIPTRLFAIVLALVAAFGWLSFSHAKYPSHPSTRETFIPWFAEKVQAVNAEILSDRHKLQSIYAAWKKQPHLDNADWQTVYHLATAYDVSFPQKNKQAFWADLLSRVDIVPVSLVIAQAGHESAWGQSRFAREANNYFGEWCFRSGCGIVPRQRPVGKHYEVAKFRTPEEAIESYEHNLNAHGAYRSFRTLRASLRKKGKPITGLSVVVGIANYNPSRGKYTRLIAQVIREFDLEKYDL